MSNEKDTIVIFWRRRFEQTEGNLHVQTSYEPEQKNKLNYVKPHEGLGRQCLPLFHENSAMCSNHSEHIPTRT